MDSICGAHPAHANVLWAAWLLLVACITGIATPIIGSLGCHSCCPHIQNPMLRYLGVITLCQCRWPTQVRRCESEAARPPWAPVRVADAGSTFSVGSSSAALSATTEPPRASCGRLLCTPPPSLCQCWGRYLCRWWRGAPSPRVARDRTGVAARERPVQRLTGTLKRGGDANGCFLCRRCLVRSSLLAVDARCAVN